MNANMRCILLLSFVLTSLAIFSQEDSLVFDPLLLEEVVVSDLKTAKKIGASTSISSIPSPADLQLQGVASTLQRVPGLFADASTGEVFSRVYARGISLSAEDDIGWYYMSLQEDGLPISAVQYNQFSPDFFFRPDVSHARMEVVKGGKSSIIAPGGPGGIVNFISEKTPNGSYQTHDRLTGGVYANGRPYIRVEGYSGARIGESTWAYDFAYLYRHDRGPRDLDYALNNGGQIKAGLQKLLPKGILTFKFKWLDDRVNRYQGVAATGWEDPQPAFGQSFQTTSLLPPSINDGAVVDPRTYDGSNVSRTPYDPANGIKTDEIAATVGLDISLGEWRLTNKFKYSAKRLNWQTAIGGQPLALDNFITYFVSGDPFPIGAVSFTDVNTNQTLATVNNAGAFAVFQGDPPSFEYIDGSLPNDAILGSGTWYKDDHIDEWMNQLNLQRSWSDVDLTLGTFVSNSAVDILTSASFLYGTYEASPRIVSVALTDFDGSTRPLSDANGLSNLGGLFYEGADISSGQWHVYADADLNMTSSLDVNVGLRYERISHSGTRDRSAPAENIGTLVKSGEDVIDATYNYLNYSIAADYQLSPSASSFIRYTLGHKAPELNYYINNFTNQDIPSEDPPAQTIRQLEIGAKLKTRNISLTATLFNSQLGDVAFSNFVFDQMESRIFYTPTQFNSSNTTGLELEWAAAVTDHIALDATATLQNPKLSTFTLYDANETIETDDDRTIDFSDNRIPHNPSFMGSMGITYDRSAWFGGARYNYMGKRFGNIANAFELPAYGTIDLDLGYALSNSWSLGLRVRNLFNSAGLINFFGPNQFGSNSDAASPEFISANPDASFVVFPISPRAVYLSVDYRFGK